MRADSARCQQMRDGLGLFPVLMPWITRVANQH